MKKTNNYPDIVYKYRNWTDDFHKDVLCENHLFLTSPKYFNDPFDCRVPTNYTSLNTDDKIRSFVDKKMIKFFDHLENEKRDIAYEMKKLENRLSNDMANYQKEHEDVLYKSQDKHYGILSLSSLWNSILMWSHYADNHKGICIGFWEEKLRNCGAFGKGGSVVYPPDNNFPFIDPLSEDLMVNSFTETHYKAKDWSYENEYRLMKLFYPNEPEDADRTIKIPDDFFAEIVLGLDTVEKDREEIIKIAKRKNIRVYQTVKTPFMFQLDRIEIK